MTGMLTHQDVQGGQWFTRFAKGVSMRANDHIVGYEVDYTISMRNEIIHFLFQIRALIFTCHNVVSIKVSMLQYVILK